MITFEEYQFKIKHSNISKHSLMPARSWKDGDVVYSYNIRDKRDNEDTYKFVEIILHDVSFDIDSEDEKYLVFRREISKRFDGSPLNKNMNDSKTRYWKILFDKYVWYEYSEGEVITCTDPDLTYKECCDIIDKRKEENA